MDRDPLVRVLLFGILAALVALVMQAGDGGTPLSGGTAGRYTLDSLRAGSPVLFRLDSQTGKTWKLELRGGNDTWKPIREPDEAETVDATGPQQRYSTSRVPPPPTTPPPAPAPLPAPVTPPLPGKEGPEWDVEALARAVQKTDLDVDLRIWSAGRLALQDVPRSTEALLAVQGDSDPAVVAAALTALKGRYDARISEAVASARSHPDPTVRAAAQAFGE